MNRKIDVMIVGAQKAGTTSLLRYLGEHPDCISHPQKEFSYFTDAGEFEEGPDLAFRKYFSQQDYKGKKIVAKNAALFTSEDGLKRLKSNNPSCSIVLIIRNPVERAYSSYLMEKNHGTAKFEFSELPELIRHHEENDESWGFSFFIDYGLYASYLEKIYQYFPKEQVTVLLYRDLKKDPLSLCKGIFEKIGVDPAFRPAVEIKHNVTRQTYSQTYARMVKHLLKNSSPLKKFLKKFIPENKAYKYGDLLREINKKKEKRHSTMTPEVKQFLIDFYKPHNDVLQKMIGKDLSDWNK